MSEFLFLLLSIAWRYFLSLFVMPYATRSGSIMSKTIDKVEQDHAVLAPGQIACDDSVNVVAASDVTAGTDPNAAFGGAPEAADSADISSVLGTLQAMNSTLVAFGQALGDQASRVTTMEENLAKACATSGVLSAVSTDLSQTTASGGTHDVLSTEVTSGPRRLAPQHEVPIGPTRCDLGRRFARPHEFDGSSPWRSFITQFEAIASGHSWTAADKLGELVACLRGPALEVFAYLPDADRLDYRSLTASLESRFGVTKQEPWFRSQLRCRTRGAGETLPCLARDVERLVAMAYPSAVQELRDTLACDHFLGALNDADLQIAVRQGRPSSLQEALAHAMEIEAIRRSVGSSRPMGGEAAGASACVRGSRTTENEPPPRRPDAPSTSDALRQILHSLNDLKKELNRDTPSRGRGLRGQNWGSGTLGVCWSCGDKGHIRRNCPRRSPNPVGRSSPKASEN